MINSILCKNVSSNNTVSPNSSYLKTAFARRKVSQRRDMITYVHKLKQQINSFESIYEDEYGNKPKVYYYYYFFIVFYFLFYF